MPISERQETTTSQEAEGRGTCAIFATIIKGFALWRSKECTVQLGQDSASLPSPQPKSIRIIKRMNQLRKS